MDILPSHLGTGWSIAVIQERAAAATASHAPRRGIVRRAMAASAKPRLGILGRFWTKGTGLSDEERAEVLKSMGSVTGGFAGGFGVGSLGFLFPATVVFTQGHPEIGVIFTALWFAMFSTGMLLPGVLLQRWCHNPLSIAEVEALYEQRHGLPLNADGLEVDGLERAYLTLVRDAIKQDVPEQAAREVQTAIRAIGEAIERLLPVSLSSEVDADKLRRESLRVQQEAANETDTMTAASLLRQAEALLRSAQAAERSSVLLRRNAALRQELVAQVEALRLGLAALYAGAGDMTELVRLAEQVRGVANEANAVADARAELDSFVVTSPKTQDALPVTESLPTAPITPASHSTAPAMQVSLRK